MAVYFLANVLTGTRVFCFIWDVKPRLLRPNKLTSEIFEVKRRIPRLYNVKIMAEKSLRSIFFKFRLKFITFKMKAYFKNTSKLQQTFACLCSLPYKTCLKNHVIQTGFQIKTLYLRTIIHYNTK